MEIRGHAEAKTWLAGLESQWQAGRIDDCRREANAPLGCRANEVLQQGEFGARFAQILALLASDEGAVEEALEAFARSATLCPENAAYAFNHANALQVAGESSRAVAAFRSVIARAVDATEKTASINPDCSSWLSNDKPLTERVPIKGTPTVVNAVPFAKPKADGYLSRAHFGLGLALRDEGEILAAFHAFDEALLIEPDFVAALNNGGELLMRLGEWEEAEIFFKRAIVLDNTCVPAIVNLGRLYLEHISLPEALACFEQALQVDGQAIDAYKGMGEYFYLRGRYADAMDWYRKGLLESPNDEACRYLLAKALQVQGSLDEALLILNELCAATPGQLDYQTLLVSVLEKKGERQAAADALRPLLEIHGDSPAVLRYGSELYRELGLSSEEMAAKVLPVVADQKVSGRLRSAVAFLAYKLCEKNENYDQAFACLRVGNDLSRQNFDIKFVTNEFSEIQRIFSKDNFSQMARASEVGSAEDFSPIFIVGMPRSCSTLVEQILNAHPAVFTAGESDALPCLLDNLSAGLGSSLAYPQCFADESLAIDSSEMASMATGYREGMAQRLSRNEKELSGRWVIDKNLFNFQHLALIRLMFPQAKIIHCRRDALDTCFSIYAQRLHQRFSNALVDIGHYYKAYEDMMNYHIDELGIDVMTIQQQDLVAAPEETSRALLTYCDLPWNDACLRFYENKSFARTASYNQVRQPINGAGLGRWKHYEKHLEELMEIING